MKETIRTATIAIILVFALGVILQIGNAVETTGETVQQWSPEKQATAQIALDRREQEAQATATYLSVLSNEVVSDTQNTHAIMRKSEQERYTREQQLQQVVNFGKMSLWVSGTLAVSIASVGFGYGIARRSSTVALRDGVHLLPNGNWIDTRTALVSGTKQERIPDMHAKDLLEYRSVVVKALASAFVENGGVKLLTGRDNE